VRAVWWLLEHPETHGCQSGGNHRTVQETFVECDVANGPYASERSRKTVEAARARGVEAPEFQVDRYSLRGRDLSAENDE